MKTSRPVDARLWAAGEDPDLQSELGGEYTRPCGDCHEHAAWADHPQVIGEGPGLSITPCKRSATVLRLDEDARKGPRSVRLVRARVAIASPSALLKVDGGSRA